MFRKAILSILFILTLTLSLGAEEVVVKPGDTFTTIFTRMFEYNKVIELYNELKSKVPGFVLKAGQKIIFGANYAHIPIDITKDVKILKKDDDYEINLIEHDLYTINTVVTGSIEGSLFESINRLGESDELAMNFADIYQWEVDFFKEVRPGDRFSIVVEKRFVKGTFAGYGKILLQIFIIMED